MSSADDEQALRWIDELGKLVRTERDRPFDLSPELRQEAVIRLLAGLRGLNRNHLYRVASYDRVPAVQITSVDGRKTEIDFQDTSGRHAVRETVGPAASVGLVSTSSVVNIGCHVRRPFEFQGLVSPLG